MKNMKWFIGLIRFALMGCGGDDGALMQGGTATAAQMQSGTVVQAVTQVLSFMKAGAGPVTPPGTGLPNGVGVLSVGPFAATVYDNCKEALANDDTDTDGDGIHKNIKIRYNCQNVPSTDVNSTRTGKFTGTYEERDLKDIDASTKYAAGGYEYSYDLFEIDADPPGPGLPPWETSWTGTYSAKPTATSLTYASDYEYAYKGYDGGGPWFKLDWMGKIQNESVYKPVSMANPYDEGSVSHTGLYKMAGYVGSDGNGHDLGNVTITFKIESKDLTYKSSCANYYKSGEMSFEGSPGSKLVLKFHCDDPTEVLFNGQPINMNL